MVTRGLAAAVALVLLTGACTGDGDADEPESGSAAVVSDPPLLEPAWTADVGAAAQPVPRDIFAFRSHGDLDLWRTDDTVVVIGKQGLSAFDAATGEPAWTLTPPDRLGTICSTAVDPGPTGVGGLLFATKQGCDSAGAVDLATGELLWSAPLDARRVDPTYADHPLHVGSRVLTVEVPCEESRRFDLTTGEPVRELTPRSGGCVRDLALGDGVVAVSDKEAETLTLADGDTGRQLWTRPFPGAGAVTGVVSTDPLVLAVEQTGHELYRHFDDSGRPGEPLGRQYDSPPKLVGVLDGVLVVSYTIGTVDTPWFRGFDVATGEQLWSRVDDLFVAGEQDGRILTLQRPLVATDHEEELVWVGRADPRDPADEVALGSVPHDPEARFGWTGDLLLRQVGGTVEAYVLPAAEEDSGAEPLPEVPPLQEEPPWAEGDVRPEEVADICLAVPTATIRSLGFRSADLPVPATCTWHDVLDQPGVDRLLSVEAFALAPTATTTADEAAIAALEETRDDGPDDTNYVGRFRPLPGLGDEAIAAGREKGGEVEGRLVVRSGNVVLVVHGWVRSYAGRALPSVAELRAGQETVVEELLATLP